MSATANYKISACRMISGTFTHTEGDTDDTLDVAGYVIAGIVNNVDSSGGVAVPMTYSVSRSTTTGISTITIQNNGAVTDGRFVFFVSSM